MSRKALITIFAAALIALTGWLLGCGGNSGSGPEETPKADWTILAYIDGNCSLDDTPAGSFFINKVQDMEKTGSTDDVHIITLISSMKVGGGAKYYYVEENQNEPIDVISSPMLRNLGSTDMSDGTVLKAFIEYVTTQSAYDAEHYMLIIGNHGGGWRGVCWDEIQDPNGGACITMPELRTNLAAAGKKFDIIAFDCCLMGMAEVATAVGDYADYMISSQNVTWANVDLGYEEWIPALVAEPDMEARDLAEMIATGIYNVGNMQGKPVCTSVIDLSKLPALSTTLRDFLTTFLVTTYADPLFNARVACHTEDDAPDAVDLKEFALQLKQQPEIGTIPALENAAQALADAVSQAVPFKENNVEYARNGLSLYFPIDWDHYTATDIDTYGDLRFEANTGWLAFLDAMIQSLGGGGGGGGQYGALQINSSPAGATVNIDGTDYGTTPIGFTDVEPGDYAVQLTLSGYETWQQTVTVTAGQTTTVNATLTPSGGGGQYGALQINSSPAGASVFIDGTGYGTTPLGLTDVPPGSYSVQLTLTGYQTWQQTVSVTAGQTTTVNATLTPSGGGGGTATVSGTASWPGHGLSGYAFCFLDSSHTYDIVPVAYGTVNPSTGQFSVSIDLSSPMEVWVAAFDDLNNDGYIDVGEGLGYSNGMITLDPGETVSGVSIVLEAVTDGGKGKNTKGALR